MLIKLMNSALNAERVQDGERLIHYQDQLREPTIVFDGVELRNRTAQDVVRVEIENNDGLFGRFQLIIRINEQGQPVAKLVADVNGRDETGQVVRKQTIKEAKASWRL